MRTWFLGTRNCLRRSVLVVCLVVLGLLAPARSSFGDLLAGDYATSGVRRLDDDGNPIAGGVTPGSTNLSAVSGVTVGPHDNNIYVSSFLTGEIYYFDGATGAPLNTDGVFVNFASVPGPLRFDPAGDFLYVSDFGGSTVRVFDATTGAEQAPAITGFGPPAGMTFAPNGDLYAGDFLTGRVDRVHNGTQEPFITSGQLQSPSSLLFLPNGDLLAVDQNTSKIERFDSDGTYLGTFAAVTHTIAGINFPSDITYDADGNLVLAVLGDAVNSGIPSRLLRYDLDGNLLETLLELPPDPMDPNTGVLSSVAWIKAAGAVTGDYDGNGTVGPEDYQKWKDDYGKTVAKGGGADGNGDGIVSAADYTTWRNALAGLPGTGAAVAAQVPEPSTMLLVAACACSLLLPHRSGRTARTRR